MPTSHLPSALTTLHQPPDVICGPFLHSHEDKEDEGFSDVEEFVTAELDSMTISDESGIEEQRQLEAKRKQEELEAIKSEISTA